MSDTHTTCPTWAPTWCERSKELTLKDAQAYTPAKAKLLESANLQVAGVRIGTVRNATSITVKERAEDNAAEIRRIVSSVVTEPSAAMPADLEGICEVLAIGDSNVTGQYHDDSILQSAVQDVLTVLENLSPVDYSKDSLAFLRRFAQICDNKTLISDTSDHVGLEPPLAKSGDEICVILGCPKPLVLRKTGRFQYQVVGEAYMSGYMNGEAILGAMPADWEYFFEVDAETDCVHTWFSNLNTLEQSLQDPRHAKFLVDGKPLDSVRIRSYGHFPALTAERLKEAGVDIVDFELI